MNEVLHQDESADQELEITANHDHQPSNRISSTRASSRKNRIYVFREFLLETYGLAYLRQGPILDVAGGKGDLSFLLKNVDQVNSIVVDPRLTCHRSLLRSVEYLRKHPDEAALRRRRCRPQQGHNTTSLSSYHQPLASLLDQLPPTLEAPRHLRILVNQDLVTAVSNYLTSLDLDEWECSFLQLLEVGQHSQPWFGSAAQERFLPPQSSSNDATFPVVTAILDDAHEALMMILHTSLIVGFHPDQATDACIDLASLLNVPFCVVPCCVFPKAFPFRRCRKIVESFRLPINNMNKNNNNARDDDKDNENYSNQNISNNMDDISNATEPVRTYSQLIQYLMDKAPQGETSYLRFFKDKKESTMSTSSTAAAPARNMVLFTRKK